MLPKNNRSRAPQVSIVIPVREIGYYIIYENLPGMAKLQHDSFEVIILPNQHTTYDMTLLEQYPWLRIIPTGTVTRPAMKRDIGVQHAKGEYIAFIDDDAYPDPDWLTHALPYFDKKSIAAVCGPGVLPPEVSRWEQIFDDILTSKIGSGNYTYRFAKGKQQFVTDYPSMNFIIRKSAFERVGGFDNDYWPGEDSKLCNDLIKKNKKAIVYDPDVLVYHHRRNEPAPFLKQHGQYGYHRGAFYAEGDENSRDLAYLVPSAFALYLTCLVPAVLTSLVLRAPVYVFAAILAPLLLYLMLLLYIMALSFLRRRSVIISFGAAAILLAMHLMYGRMFIKGYLRVTSKQHIYG